MSRVGRRLGPEASDLRGKAPPAKPRHERSFLAQQQRRLLLPLVFRQSITTAAAKSLKIVPLYEFIIHQIYSSRKLVNESTVFLFFSFCVLLLRHLGSLMAAHWCQTALECPSYRRGPFNPFRLICNTRRLASLFSRPLFWLSRPPLINFNIELPIRFASAGLLFFYPSYPPFRQHFYSFFLSFPLVLLFHFRVFNTFLFLPTTTF